MKKSFLFALFIPLLLLSCEEEEKVPQSRLPEMYNGKIVKSLVSRPSGSDSWMPYDYITIFIDNEGRYYSLDQGSERVCEGSFYWYNENGQQKLALYDSDRDQAHDLFFDVIRYDENHMIVNIMWGSEKKEWILCTGSANLTGIVIDKNNGMPLTNATIHVESENALITSTYTDEYGYFALDNTMPNINDLTEATHFNVYSGAHEDQSVDVSIREGIPNFTLVRMNEGESSLGKGILTGMVTDEENNPLENAEVTIEGTQITVTTSFDGSYVVSVPEGSQNVMAGYEGYDTKFQPVTIEQLEEYTVNFQLSPEGFNIGGMITHIGDVSIEGVQLTLKDEQNNQIGSLSCSGDGSFNFEAIEDGTYIISPSSSNMQFVPNQYPVHIKGKEVSDIHFLAMEKGTTGIGGQVTKWDSDEPLDHVNVIADGKTILTNQDGYYLMELPENNSSCVLKATKDSYLDRYQSKNITAGELHWCNLNMATFNQAVVSTLNGYIYDSETNQPISDAVITVDNNNQTTSSPQGDYSLELQVYDEQVIQYIKCIASKSGYKTDTLTISFYGEFISLYNFYLDKE